MLHFSSAKALIIFSALLSTMTAITSATISVVVFLTPSSASQPYSFNPITIAAGRPSQYQKTAPNFSSVNTACGGCKLSLSGSIDAQCSTQELADACCYSLPN